MDIKFEDFLNKVINDFYTIIVEDALRAGLHPNARQIYVDMPPLALPMFYSVFMKKISARSIFTAYMQAMN